MKLQLERKILYIALFMALVAMAGFGQFAGSVDASANSNPNATIPPPGGTLPPNSAGIQLLHLAPFATDSNVNATINGTGVNVQYNNVGLGESTGAYLAVPAGTVNGSVTPIGGGTPFTFAETLAPSIEHTTAVIGGANGWPIEFLTLVDTTTDPQQLHGKVRIVHAAPFAAAPAINTAVNVVDQSGANIDALFQGLLYAESTPYIELPIGHYDWKVDLPGGTAFIDLPAFTLYADAIVTIYIVGDATIQSGAGLFVIQQLGLEPTLMYLPVIQAQ